MAVTVVVGVAVSVTVDATIVESVVTVVAVVVFASVAVGKDSVHLFCTLSFIVILKLNSNRPNGITQRQLQSAPTPTVGSQHSC